MIKLEKTEVFGWESAIRGMRNPMNSWDKSDSTMCHGSDGFEDCTVNACGVCPRHEDFRYDIFCVGANDLKLMKSLVKAGSDHRKFLRFIDVTVDITAPLYWWKEFDTYKVGTVANSCSTMHKIHAKEFTLDDFSHEHLDDSLCLGLEINEERSEDGLGITAKSSLELIISLLNCYREKYLRTHDKYWWWQMIQLLPSSYNQKRTVQLNYEVLLNMYHARWNHKLDEWVYFCEWMQTLPYFCEICLEK